MPRSTRAEQPGVTYTQDGPWTPVVHATVTSTGHRRQVHRATPPGRLLLVAILAVLGLVQVAQVTGLPASPQETPDPPSGGLLVPPGLVQRVSAETAVGAPVPATLGVASDARWAVAVRDVRTGRQVAWGDPGTFHTASVVKVDVLLALLLKAQDAGRGLTAAESGLATAMITHSDNEATNILLPQVGGTAGVEAVHARLGLAEVDLVFAWGLTRTTAAAQLDLLAVITGDHPGLGEPYRVVAQDLMRRVVADQRFGATAAADDPASAMVKVGYLPRSGTGRWDVTSVGVVDRGGQRYLVSVLTEGTTSREAGAALTDQLAVAAVRAIARI